MSYRATRLLRQLLGLAILALAALHGWLLWRRLADGALLETSVALRWLGAVALGFGALWLRRQGVSLWRGRPAAIFWLAVLVLHAGAPAPLTGAGSLAHQLPPELIVLFSIPVLLEGLVTRLSSRAKPALRAFPPRRRAPVLAPILAAPYPPIRRRPPPF